MIEMLTKGRFLEAAEQRGGCRPEARVHLRHLQNLIKGGALNGNVADVA